MCLGIPGEVVALDPTRPDLAKVEVSGVRRTVNVALVADGGIAPGDWVLIHVGFALSRIDEAEAQATLALLRGMGQAYEEELAALRASPAAAPGVSGGAAVRPSAVRDAGPPGRDAGAGRDAGPSGRDRGR